MKIRLSKITWIDVIVLVVGPVKVKADKVSAMSKDNKNIRNIIKELNEEEEIKSTVDAFLFSIRDIDDPRDVERCDHTGDEILLIALVTTICGATSYRKIVCFGEAQPEWLQQFIPLKNGALSRDTFL